MEVLTESGHSEAYKLAKHIYGMAARFCAVRQESGEELSIALRYIDNQIPQKQRQKVTEYLHAIDAFMRGDIPSEDQQIDIQLIYGFAVTRCPKDPLSIALKHPLVRSSSKLEVFLRSRHELLHNEDLETA